MNENKRSNGATEAIEEAKLDLSSLGRFASEIKTASASQSGEDDFSFHPIEPEEDSLILGDLAGGDGLLSDTSPCDPEALYEAAVKMIESGSGLFDRALDYLKKSAEEGYAASWIYLGRLFGNEMSAIYDPQYALECFTHGADMGFAEGYYYLGICYMNGVGCSADPEKAVEALLLGGEQGHTESIRTLGICREMGIGCEIDYRLAAKLYDRAAADGDAIAINNLGGCYFYGHGVPKDRERAFELYKQAAELGDPNAACRLGICYEEGEICEKDDDKAFACYNFASELGNALAIYRLALCFDNGVGVEQNFARAFAYFNRSANAGCAPAMYHVGLMSKHGRGTKKSASSAYKMFSAAAGEGHSDAAYELGNCNLEGIGTVKNAELGYLHYLEAIELDNKNANAAFKLGLCNLKGLGTAKDPTIAFEWFCRGRELGSSDAAYMKGECYFYGVGVQQNTTKAIDSYRDAILMSNEKGSIDATIALAKCLEKDIGPERDPEAAVSLYKLAAELGSAEASYELGRMIMEGATLRNDRVDARTYILRAARSEYPPAMLAMGIFADEGHGVAKNASDAERWYTKTISSPSKLPEIDEFPERFTERSSALADSRTEAQYRLGMLLSRTAASPIIYVRAFENIAFAASLGHKEAQTEVARIYLHGGDLKSYYDTPVSNRSEKAVTKEILGGAINKLGDSYFDGKALVKKNEATAARCYKIAAELGDIDASYSYGWCLRHGVGVTENNLEAIKWLKSAADRGNINAAYSYGLCCEEGAGTGIKNKRDARSYYRKAAAAGHIEAAKRYMALSQ